ncbi:unnamed protein product [Phaedon cochleariae]|uniref:Peptidase S1 domain-containing protein n=1 Tax=Phaedon cochleariae TaxID=80249 RepID=A0A9N9SCH5_PHACE|nr:unnamed protein product [Phaedon cochleariae]
MEKCFENNRFQPEPINKPEVDPSLEIVNGQEVVPHSIPYQIFLVASAGGSSWSCGGSLITKRYVLTAAHCLDGAKSIRVTLGAHNLAKHEAGTVTVNGRSWVIHEKYDSTNIDNDIGVIQLERNLTLTRNIQLVRLPALRDVGVNLEGRTATVSGWGLTNGIFQTTTDVLRKANNTIISNRECNDAFGIVQPTEVCLSSAGGRSACSGDSGGPLVIGNVQHEPINQPEVDPSLEIVNGQEVVPHSIPYQIFLVASAGGSSWSCGGSLITKRYVLTAAHCLDGAKSIRVTLGAHNLAKHEAGTVTVNGRSWVIHEKYDSTNIDNDIGVIQLERNLTLTRNIQLVRLPSLRDVGVNLEGRTATVSGWGLTNGIFQTTTDVLRAANNTIISNRECNDAFGIVQPTEVCLSSAGGRSACSGDSGGPLVIGNVQHEPINQPEVDPSLEIVNGQEVVPHSIPYQIFLIASAGGSSWSCGGSLITKRYVLTAAHCLDGAESVRVTLGAHNLAKHEASTVTVNGRSWVIHEKYDSRNIDNDIGVIQLERNLTLTRNIQLVRLPALRDVGVNLEGRTATVSGWGLTNGISKTTTDVLRATNNTIISNKECNDAIGIVQPTEVCLSSAGGRSSCSGDSGGPLVIGNVQHGIVSYGPLYCMSAPSVFTRVSSYLNWLISHSEWRPEEIRLD